jgi:acetyltransferase-like isoleucine patch superfamily enzyme
MMDEKRKLFHELQPGQNIEGDWCNFPIPTNMEVGENSVFDSSFTFKNFFSTLPVGLKIGKSVTIRSAVLSTEPDAYIEVGDYTMILNASIAAYNKILIGSHVFIAGGVNIVDTDFHPIAPDERMADTIALSPAGDKHIRPHFTSQPVVIEDGVWIGFNATILKGVRIGKGAVIQPGSVVLKDVEAGAIVAGNPARVVDLIEKHELRPTS